jgi:hypothetical protein
MIICPDCSTQQIYGSLFCLECGGFLLGGDDSLPGIEIQPQPAAILGVSEQRSPYGDAANTQISLLVLETQCTLRLEGKEVYTLGRLSEGQSILPDIDLTPHLAYEKGVSRLHAAIRTSIDGIAVIDLGSVNGTRLNGVKIMPTKAYPLQNQDVLDLGKLKVMILFTTAETFKDGE